ncbi:AAA family ATPase [Micromonospora sp. DT63]|uniref:AAA family ATPase n=1 Tax=Micromonospora sp. DT63 TaxID=3393441 RepID=UPI003CE9429E
MLTLQGLAVRDFGPYRGRQDMAFSRDRGVYIIYGPNGRGKTTLHNAFRYALYGEILGRRRAEEARDLANTEAKKQVGYGSFETILDFEYGGVQHRLTRRYDERKQPHELALLERAGVPLAQDDMEKTLQTIAPYSVSQFFLFDGELLRQYENLLDKDSEEGEALEKSIERVLGIPIVGNARADVAELHKFADRQLTEQYATSDKTRRTALSLREAQDVAGRQQQARDEIVERIDMVQDQITDLELQLREQEKSERILGALDNLRQRQASLDLREREAIAGLDELTGGLWKAVLSRSAAQRLAAVEAEVESAEADLLAASAAVRDLAHLHAETNCPVCHRDVPEKLRSQLTSELKAAASVTHHAAVEARLSEARHRRRVLQALASEDARLVAERDKGLRSVRFEQQEVRADIIGLEQELAELGSETALRDLTAKRVERQTQLNRERDRLQACDKELHDQSLVIEELKRRLRKEQVQPDPSIALKEQLTHALMQLFAGSIDAYRAKLRRRVEARASEIFRQLASETDYVGLRITDRYGLEIIDSDGEVVRRSAGYEHLVALSLIAALQDSAAVRGPVIMDYPFGRLDTDNTARVVAALPRMARQVVLLSFDGEFDRTEALNALGSNLVAEYELERVTSKHTRIQPRRTI